MTPNEQLTEWVRGNSIHNDERYYDVVDDDDNIVGRDKMEGGECCPDFSCCQPDLKWGLEERIAYANNPAVRNRMLSTALSSLLLNTPDVYVAGAIDL